MSKTGYYSSFETFGAVDGPGIRLVYFLQGCVFRCLYCHNPETQEFNTNKPISIDDILDVYEKNKNYYRNGGITLSGGEPLAQLDFAIELFTEAKKRGIHTCADTALGTFNEKNLPKFEKLIEVCDLFIVDIKHTDPEWHQKLINAPNDGPLNGLKWLDDHGAKTWVRHVLVPSWTDQEENLIRIGEIISGLKNMIKFEILPYHNMMIPKYKMLKRKFELNDINPPRKDETDRAMRLIKLGVAQADVERAKREGTVIVDTNNLMKK